MDEALLTAEGRPLGEASAIVRGSKVARWKFERVHYWIVLHLGITKVLRWQVHVHFEHVELVVWVIQTDPVVGQVKVLLKDLVAYLTHDPDIIAQVLIGLT